MEMPPRYTAKWFSAILKLTPCSFFIKGIWEGQISFTKNVVRKWKGFNLLFPNIVKKAVFKKKIEVPQIETYPKK
jgi:hypothetical protein